MPTQTLSRVLSRYREARRIQRLHILEALIRSGRMDAVRVIAKQASPHLI